MPSVGYKDTKIDDGLVERRYANGRVVYRSRVWLSESKSKLVTFDFDGKQARTEAKEKHRDRQKERRQGTLTVDSMTLTLGEARDRAWQHYQEIIDLDGANGQKPPIEQAALDGHKTAWRKRVAPYEYKEGRSLDEIKLGDFSKIVAREWLLWLAKSGVAPSTQNGTLSAVRNVLRWARNFDKMQHDPFQDIPTTERPSQDPRRGWVGKKFTKPQLASICEAARSDEFVAATPDALLSEAVIMYRWEGVRLSELAGQRWSDVDLDGEIVWVRQQRDRVRKEETKGLKWGRSERPLGMTSDLIASYTRQRAHEWSKGRGKHDDFVFTNADGKPVTVDQLKGAVRRATRLAGFGKHGPQTLRRSFGTQLAHSEFELVEGAAMMGHSVEVHDKSYVGPYRNVVQLKANARRLEA